MFAETETECNNWEASMKEEITALEEQCNSKHKTARKEQTSYRKTNIIFYQAMKIQSNLTQA